MPRDTGLVRLREVLGARRRWFERHPRLQLTLAATAAVFFLALAVLRLMSRDGPWVLFSIVLALAGASQVAEVRRIRSRIRAAADPTNAGHVDDRDGEGGLADGLGEVSHAERQVPGEHR